MGSGFLDSLVKLTRWSRLGTVFSCRWHCECFPTWAEQQAEQQEGVQSLYGSCLGDQNQACMWNEFPGQVRPPVLLCRGKPWVGSLFQCLCKWGYQMSYTVSCVLWLGRLEAVFSYECG